MNIRQLKKYRKHLHQHPELSGKENFTAEWIAERLKEYKTDRVWENIGGTGVMALFKSVSGKAEKSIIFRAELDAIAVKEETGVPYESTNSGVMHGCGHDGHMTILLGLAQWLEQNRPENKDVYLLFQPAEETGEGAQQVLSDKTFKRMQFDYAFALHNLPGFDEGNIIVRKGTFAAASTGLEITFKGKSSHAAFPEKGLNPSLLIAQMVLDIEEIMEPYRKDDPLNKAVNTFIKLGEPAYGISPGQGKAGFTLRSASDNVLDEMVEHVKKEVSKISDKFKGEVSSELVEPFSAIVNDDKGVDFVEHSAKENGYTVEHLPEPFPWSEDFGEFRKKCPITIFGLGAGKDYAPLHSEVYDFNDSVIETGVRTFIGILKRL